MSHLYGFPFKSKKKIDNTSYFKNVGYSYYYTSPPSLQPETTPPLSPPTPPQLPEDRIDEREEIIRRNEKLQKIIKFEKKKKKLREMIEEIKKMIKEIQGKNGDEIKILTIKTLVELKNLLRYVIENLYDSNGDLPIDLDLRKDILKVTKEYFGNKGEFTDIITRMEDLESHDKKTYQELLDLITGVDQQESYYFSQYLF